MEARAWFGPLFWLHGDETQQRLEMYVGKVAEGGNGSFTAESRPDPDWLGPNWYRDVGICLNAGKTHGLKMWIFDEQWWPSQDVAGTVPAQYGSKRLGVTVTNVTGPIRFVANGYSGNMIGVVGGKLAASTIDGSSLLDLTGLVAGGTLTWDAPAGNWQVMQFTWAPQLTGSRYLLDGASPDGVDWFLQTVYQPHHDHFAADFGSNILGYFYDEPETHGDWGTDVMRVLTERGVDWKKALVAYKFTLAGEEQLAARYQYLDAFAEAWGRTLYGGMSDWCRAHDVLSIGHFLEHGYLYLSASYCAGNMFQLQKYSDMGAIDAVFSQFVWGQRAGNGLWQTPKLGSSISHAYGKTNDLAMVEIFGARGQDLTYPEMKWWADHMQASGINFLIPHSFNPRAPYDTDCPPYFYNGGYEPRWPLYRVFADWSCRLNLMLTGGQHVAPVALLFPGQSTHVGSYVTPEQMSESLQDALYDCDWLPYDVFEQDAVALGKRIGLRSESYQVLVVPPVQVIPYGTLAKARSFFDGGGVVIGYGFLPTNSASLGRTSADIAQLRNAIWGNASPGLTVCRTNGVGGRSYLLPAQPTPEQLQQVLATDAGIHPSLEVVEGETSHWLHVLHRRKSGQDIFFIANQNLDRQRPFRFCIQADGTPECWDPMRNEFTAVSFTRAGSVAEVRMTLQPNESTLLVFQGTNRDLPPRIEAGHVIASTVVDIVRDPSPPPGQTNPTYVSLDGCWWVWYPEGDPTQSAPVGTRFFRKQLSIPADRSISKATFYGTADNYFVLFANGTTAGHSDGSANGWRNPVTIDLTTLLMPGTNQLAFSATNFAPNASPAGLIGKFTIEFTQGPSIETYIDGTWKTFNTEQAGWATGSYNDSAWPFVRVLTQYGGAPWNRSCDNLTLSPVSADPFYGHCILPNEMLQTNKAIYVEMDSLAPEAAARVTINDENAGGFIGAPLRLEISKHLRPGTNTIRFEPFAPPSARIVTYVSVTNVGPPSVSISSPTNGATFSEGATFKMCAEASSSNSLITAVDFYVNNRFYASQHGEPYQVPICVTSKCQLTLTAVAMNNAALVSTSTPVTVIVAGAEPVMPVMNGLKLWLKADAGILTNSAGAVLQWADQSGNGNYASQANASLAPVFRSRSANGEPCLAFTPLPDGTAQQLVVPSSSSVAITGDITSLFVVRFEDFASYRCVWTKATGRLAAPTDYWLAPVSTGRPGRPEFYRGDGTNYGMVRAVSSAVAGEWVGLGFRMAGTNVTHFMNGTANGTGGIAVAPRDAGKPLRIGARDDAATMLKGELAEIVIYNRALSVSEREAVSAYLGLKYGLLAAYSMPRPCLEIHNSSAGNCVISWPEWASNYILERTTELGDAAWTVVDTQNTNVISLKPAAETGFYRLRAP